MKYAKDLLPGQIVFSLAGRDKGKAYMVLSRESDTELWLTDGKDRPLEKPKKKKARHLQPGPMADGLAGKLASEKGIQNCQIREILKKFEKPCACACCPVRTQGGAPVGEERRH